jgi:hypothetical protein
MVLEVSAHSSLAPLLWHVVRQNIIMAAKVCDGGGCLPHGSQEGERSNKKGPGPRYTFKYMSLVIYFLRLGSTFYGSTTSQPFKFWISG